MLLRLILGMLIAALAMPAMAKSGCHDDMPATVAMSHHAMSMPMSNRITPPAISKAWVRARRAFDLASHPRWVREVGIGGKPLTYSVRARAFRKKGVPLQEFPSLRGGPRLDIESLKALAEKTRPGVKLAAPKEKKAAAKKKR